MIESVSHDGKHVLQFDKEKHKYLLDGRRVVGPTTFIKESLPTSRGLINWEMGHALRYGWKLGQENIILTEDTTKEAIKKAIEIGKEESRKAAAVGTIVHQYAETFEKESPEAAVKELELHRDSENWDKISKGIDGFLKWKDGRKEKPLMTEQVVGYVCEGHRVSDKTDSCYCFGGMLDRLSEVDGKLRISDYKTSGGVYWDMFVQQGAYSYAVKWWFHLLVEELEIVRFDKETGEPETVVLRDTSGPEQQALRCRETYEFTKWIKKQLKKGE